MQYLTHSQSSGISTRMTTWPAVTCTTSSLSHPPPPAVAEKKRVRFANPEVEVGQESGVVRIKLVISKQELEVMLRKGGFSIDEMVYDQLKRKQISLDDQKDHEFDDHVVDDDDHDDGWKPVLESIPEVN
ncbi:hypothetical protein HYC85_006888 [Camellia sinensis]|uniref:Uncharacterized protein n=1 Tax=Camellia sinensis TaxID=4442 RepID=A0A7J7HME6_CAMSI|nr:hypothetical protein HYC85_006888 [Camellia sinensis]